MISRRELAAAVGLLLLAAALRFTGLAFGQPIPEYAPQDAALYTIHADTPLHPDEFLFVQRPLRMLLTGELNPKFFHNPSFLINTNFVLFGWTGERANLSWDGREEVGARRQAPFRLYLTGRTFSALGGVLAVAATYAAGRVLWDSYAGFVAGGIVAVSVPLVQHAHYSTTSSLAAGFVALCLWASLVSVRRFRPWAFALAGIAAGLAAGSRYNAAAVSLVVFFAGWVALYQERTLRRGGWVLLGWMLFPLTFVFTTPHLIFDTAFFLEEFRFITNQYIGDEVSPFNVSPWLGLIYELRYLAIYGLGVPGTFAAGIGLWTVWRRRAQLWPIVLVLAYVLPYGYVVLRTIRPLGADQMLVPLIPAVALLAAVGARTTEGLVSRLVLWGAVVVPLLFYAVGVVSLFVAQDTRYDVQAWAWKQLPAGAHVHLYGPYNVPLDETRYTVTRTYGTGEVVTPDDLRELGAEYVIVSDAWLQHFRRAGFIDTSLRQSVFSLLDDQYAALEQAYVVERPRIRGDSDPLHSATYWHQPGLTVYCLTDAACAVLH